MVTMMKYGNDKTVMEPWLQPFKIPKSSETIKNLIQQYKLETCPKSEFGNQER